MTNPIQSWRESRSRYQYLNRKGTIVSLTQIDTPVAGFENHTPYYVAIIKLAKGVQVTGTLVEGVIEPKIGGTVVGVLRRTCQPAPDEIVEYTVKWKVIK